VYESGSNSDQSGLAARIIDLLGGGRGGLITDVDGTISPIVIHPEEARVLPLARGALQELSEKLLLVAVVSGRAVADARKMVNVDGLVYVGNHGLEVWSPAGPQVPPEAKPWVPRLAAVIDDINRQVHHAGVSIENKGVTASLHYRQAKDPERARRELLEVLAHCVYTSGLRLEEGRMVLNLLPPLTVTKGSAVSWLAKEHQLTRLVYFGDDVTDAHAFRALKALSDTSDVQTVSVGVVGPETPLNVRQLADVHVPSVEAVADLMCQVAKGLRRAGGTMESGVATVRS
jgi:trehalose 6-phosphate phosphatase